MNVRNTRLSRHNDSSTFVRNEIFKILVMSTFGLHSHNFEMTENVFFEEFILCQIITNIIISAHLTTALAAVLQWSRMEQN